MKPDSYGRLSRVSNHQPGLSECHMAHPSIDRAIAHVRRNSEGPPLSRDLLITINFHPDAVYRDRLMIENLANEGVYRSQFETGTSNGGLTAHVGGDRWLWESRIFGTAYDHEDPVLRPKYGALNYLDQATGGSPRFGSAHLRLRPHVLTRATFCYPDSYLDPVNFGVADRMSLVGLVEAERTSMDVLDSYVEAHIHGPLNVTEDVEAIVLDPSYRNTEIEAVAKTLGCTVEWHPGFKMPFHRVANCVAYRGQEIADLAAALFEKGPLTPRHVGLALRARRADPQSLKRVWHCVARFGSPIAV